MRKFVLSMILMLFLGGCTFNKDPLDGAEIRTTTYPVTYLTNKLYGEFGEINSIYPEGASSYEYKLTEKQINNFAKSNLFIYNGLTEEKNIAKKLVNKNKNILLIDVSYGLSLTNEVPELWLSPNNYLMLAKNIKDHLNEYLNNKYIVEKVNENYDELAEILSLMDVDIRKLGSSALEQNENTILVTSNAFKYLENYGFNVISLEDTDLSKDVIIQNFKNKNYLAFINDFSITNSLTQEILLNYDGKVITINNLTDESEDEDYLSIMAKFINDLENLVME